MESTGGNALLLRFIESPHFRLLLCISYLSRYADNIGIQFTLCQKLQTFPYSDLEFYLPQICQILVTVETESAALEDFLLELCSKSTHCVLLTFWDIQGHLHDLARDPESYGFQVCRRIYNKIQYLLFNIGAPPRRTIRENVFPALIMASALLGAPAMPSLPHAVGPMAISQGKVERSHIFNILPKLSRSKSAAIDKQKKAIQQGASKVITRPNLRSVSTAAEFSTSTTNYTMQKYIQHTNNQQRVYGGGLSGVSSLPDLHRTVSNDEDEDDDDDDFVSYLATPLQEPVTNHSFGKSSFRSTRRLSDEEKVKILKTNYFRCETQFFHAINQISYRLMLVPKPARLSALRAELALLNNELPSEVDIPVLMHADTFHSNVRQHKVVRISPAEATILNSAERAPFLMLIEVIKGDITFDPHRPENIEILNRKDDRRYLFDISSKTALSPRSASAAGHHNNSNNGGNSNSYSQNSSAATPQVLEETELGDIAASPILPEYKSEVFLTSPQQERVGVFASSSPNLSTQTAVQLGTSDFPRQSTLSFSATQSSLTTAPRDPEVVTEIATHMRTAAIMLAQLEGPAGSRLPKDEVTGIKARIIASMQSLEEHSVFADAHALGGEAGERRMENDMKTGGLKKNGDDPSAANFGEEWTTKKERIRLSSPYGHHPDWDLLSCIAKTGSDLRQESFACQLIQTMSKIWNDAAVDVWVKRMRILITGEASGLVETITNGISLHSLKKSLTNKSMANGENPKGTIATVKDYFHQAFGSEDSQPYKNAQRNFVRSLAGYSLICYLLQIKDRHNGNILLDNHGHIIHIDFGFLLSNTPGKVGFEAAAFKFTYEYVDVLGGVNSPMMELFRSLMKDAFRAIRKRADDILVMVEMMQRNSDLPCFRSGHATAQLLRQRFQLQLSDAEADAYVDNYLINKSLGSIYTKLYDHYQMLTQGIYS